MNMTQICFSEIGTVIYEQKKADFSLNADEMLIRTCYSLVSAGTELAKLTGLQQVNYPFIPGNRAVGQVIEIGNSMQDFSVGDYVFAHTPHISHTKPGRFCVKVPGKMNPCHATLVGLGLVAMTVLRVARPELGDHAAVIGMGVVGNLCGQLLRNAGVEVVAVDTVEKRLEIARRCAIPHTFSANKQNIQTEIMNLTNGRGVDYVVEATGNPETIDLATSICMKQGEIILLGSPRGEYATDMVPLLNSVHLWRPHGSIQLRGAHEWRYPLYPDGYTKHSMARNAEIFFRLMESNQVHIEELITHIISPDQAESAYDGLLNHPDQYLGVIFDWTNTSCY